MKYCFVVNRFAGKGKYVEEIRKNVEEHCGAAGVAYDICLSDHIGAAREYIERLVREREAGEEIAVFACGGDGTLCETINAVMSLEDREGVYVGLVPSGTGNDFVRNFGFFFGFVNRFERIGRLKSVVIIVNSN